MALSHFHYLVTTFCLTIWTRSPAMILSMAWGFQALLFICGIATPDLNDYVFWQFLTSLFGVLLGSAFVLVTRMPQLLRARSSHATMWLIFFVWLLLFVSSQLFYGFFPTPAYPWGLIVTMVCHAILVVVLWVVMAQTSVGTVVLRDYLWTRFMFGMWLLLVIVLEAFFFLKYAIVSEKWSAYIGCTTAFVVLLAVQVSCSAMISFSSSSSSSSSKEAYRRHTDLAVSLTSGVPETNSQ